MSLTIMVAVGDQNLCQKLKSRLINQGLEVIEAINKTNILHYIQYKILNLIILGSSLNDTWDGLQVAEKIRKYNRQVPIILVTKNNTEERIIAALRIGVNDYFKHPISFNELMSSISRNLSDIVQQRNIFNIAQPLSLDNNSGFPDCDGFQPMIGESGQIKDIKTYIMKVAPTESTVLITGETGTGKELAAELIHQNSSKSQKPFISINCAALPEGLLESELFGYEKGAFTGAIASKRGKFELANEGTIFLDEIGDMTPFAQAKILRAIEKKEIHRLGGNGGIPTDVRIIAATNQDSEQMVSDGKFRKDLYYRLNVARVHLPPLRERKEDILPLINYYIKKLNHRFDRKIEGFTDETLGFLLHYDWPGNIRELKNLLEATFINLPHRKISFIDLPRHYQERLKEMNGFSESERNKLLLTLFDTNWNKSKAAQKLHWSRMTIYRKIAKYRIPTKSMS
ncbi:MAG: sigma 54-interacting transcriptional regulator [bacterium]